MSVLMIRCRRAPWRFGIRPDASPGKPSSASTTRVILTLPTFPQLISSVITPPVVCSDVQCSSRRVPAAAFRRQFVQLLLEFAVEREIAAASVSANWWRRLAPGIIGVDEEIPVLIVNVCSCLLLKLRLALRRPAGRSRRCSCFGPRQGTELRRRSPRDAPAAPEVSSQ